MNLSIFCGTNLIELDLSSTNRDDVLEELVALLANSEKVSEDTENILKALKEREKLASTGIGFGVALPHARAKGVKGMVIAFGRSEEGIDFHSLDKKPVHLFFAIVVPDTAINTHLTALGKLSYLLKDEENRQLLMDATFPQEVLDFMDLGSSS
ncbi:MAG TPA: PTS sugar transporter subunit IIA [candidate division Zixibacteria bacterium]|nr:PTS sugar transporter subunit IIA [candidate division Zixibacteria bacterium]